jgi:hypothetical protein
VGSNATAKVLRDVADLLEAKGWTQGHYARDTKGRVCAPWEPEVASFCVEGAILRCGDVLQLNAWRALYDWLKEEPADWNDSTFRTKEQVIAELRACADSLESKP